MKRNKPHKFIPSHLSAAKSPYRFCDICMRQKHYYLHQSWWWRVTHRGQTWRDSPPFSRMTSQ